MQVIKGEKKYTQNILLLGDLNINISSPNYIQLSHKLLLDYSTIYKTTIDYKFSNIEIQNIQNLHSHWSDHNIIHFEIE